VRVRTCIMGAALAAALVVGVALPGSAGDPFLRRNAAVRVVEKASPAVVNITAEELAQGRRYAVDPFFDRFFRDFFEPTMPRTFQSLGSGVVIDAQGHILTNEHVVARASRIRVSLADGREFDAELVGADPNNDIAVLRASTDASLPWLEMGSSADLMVGEPVIAIGNPFGLSHTVTTGVVSALNRSIRTESRTYHGFLQTDASINPGNSGGPLLNAEGSLIAINTAVYGNAQGIGFAIPVDVARRVVKELIEHGEVSPVWLGLDFQDLEPALLEAMRLPEGTGGVLVNRVRPGSPADRAGVRQGISTAQGFFQRLDAVTPNQMLQLEILRDTKTRTIEVRAEEIPEALIPKIVEELTGLTLEPDQGAYAVRAVRVGSHAARIGLQAGDLLLGINGRALAGPEDLRRSALEIRGQSQALLVVQRGPGRYHVTLPLG
jgi:serine protease Do